MATDPLTNTACDDKHSLNTTAVILAAGFGRRMQPLSIARHKALLKVNGIPVLQQIVDSLLSSGITNIIIVTGFQEEAIRDFIRVTYPRKSFTYAHNPNYQTTNNIVSLALAVKEIPPTNNMLLIECDLVFRRSVIEQALSMPDKNIAMVDRYALGMDGTVVSVDNGAIRQIYPPNTQECHFDFSNKFKTLNIYYFCAEFLHRSLVRLIHFYAATIDDNCYYEQVLSLIVHMQNEEILALPVEQDSWAEIDDPNDLQAAEYRFSPKSRKAILDQSYGGYWNYPVRDFSYMHNPYFPGGSLSATLRCHCLDVIGHYGSSQAILNSKLAYFERCTDNRIIALNGLSQIYPILKDVFGDRKALLPNPGFSEYRNTFSNVAFYNDLPCDATTIMDDIERRLDAIEVVVLINPNNPTGTLLPTRQLLRLTKQHPDIQWIVDESFIDFSNQPSLLSHLESAPQDNILLLKSMSKLWGVPGLRIGYAYTSNQALRGRIEEAIPIWNMNALAEYYIELSLKYRPELEGSLNKTALACRQLRDELSASPLIARVDSDCSCFLLVTLNLSMAESEDFATYLLEHHAIYVKDVSDRFEDGRPRWRLAVKSTVENLILLDAVAQYYRSSVSRDDA